jgi:methionine synthase I (cobalamin-dependent)
MADEHYFLKRLRSGGVLFDGGMGSMLIAEGLELGAPPEEWNLSRPSVVCEIHKSYLEAGARVIGTNTFGATPSRMASFGLGDRLDELNEAAVRLARDAVSAFNEAGAEKHGRPESPGETSPAINSAFVALSVGPTGKMFSPVGNASEEEIRVEFEGQIRSAGDTVDLILVETMFDVREALIAIETAKSLTEVPLAVTLTFNKTPRGFYTIMGDRCVNALKRVEEAGVDVVGANCSIASTEMVELARTLRESTALPILCQPNAGSPKVKGGVPVYEQSPSEYADDAMKLFQIGINAVGGCCGTTPDFIREVSARMRSA